MFDRPLTTVVLAMTADGKIADFARSPARFASQTDKSHLERQISLVDGVLFGAGTLRAYGTTLPISDARLLHERKARNQPLQPIHLVCSASGNLNPQLPFFQQPVPRWLLTTSTGAQFWQKSNRESFERILVADLTAENRESDKTIPHLNTINWRNALTQLSVLGLQKLAILGGGQLVASLLAVDSIDELWLTVCPSILGGVTAPTPVEGRGWLAHQAHPLELLEAKTIGQEVFLHYRFQKRDR